MLNFMLAILSNAAATSFDGHTDPAVFARALELTVDIHAAAFATHLDADGDSRPAALLSVESANTAAILVLSEEACTGSLTSGCLKGYTIDIAMVRTPETLEEGVCWEDSGDTDAWDLYQLYDPSSESGWTGWKWSGDSPNAVAIEPNEAKVFTGLYHDAQALLFQDGALADGSTASSLEGSGFHTIPGMATDADCVSTCEDIRGDAEARCQGGELASFSCGCHFIYMGESTLIITTYSYSCTLDVSKIDTELPSYCAQF
jgi:hypothetical protein